MNKRNWFKSLDTREMIICDIDGTAKSYIPFMFIEPGHNEVNIISWQSGYYLATETIETIEDLDSLIEALQKTRKVFEEE